MLTEKQSTALEGSITHWEENLAASGPDQISTSGDDCPLCQEFCNESHDDDTRCRECPVYLKTVRVGCAGTPWKWADNARYAWIGSENRDNPELKADWVAAATKELKFLKGLRDAE